MCGAAWVAMEMGVARLLSGLPWNLLGVSQYQFLPLIQIASATGVYGVSFLVAWNSVALVGAVLVAVGAPGRIRAFVREIWPCALVMGGVLICGLLNLSNSTMGVGRTLTVALVQPAVPQRVMWDPNERTNRFDLLLALSQKALAERPDLLVWPEAALPGAVARTRATQEIVTRLVRNANMWMIFGAEDSGRRRNPDGTETVEHLNSAFFVNPTGDLASRYHKCHLVPFGEYMPGARWLPFLARLRQTGAGLVSGKGPVPFQISSPLARLATLICFEDMFPHLAREYVNEDTDFLLNLTNDGWFGESAAQWQHAAGALFRAVENGVPLVRCANNGLTCWIDARGRMHEVYFPGSSDIYQAGYKIARIPLLGPSQRRERTIYNRYGDWFGWSCVAITFVALAASLRRPARLANSHP